MLVEKYPDLRRVPPNRRGEVFARKIAYDLAMNTQLGIWSGVGGSLGLFTVLATAEALAAGYLLRRRGRVFAVLLPYLELLVPSMLVLLIPGAMLRFSTVPASLASGADELDLAVLAQRRYPALALLSSEAVMLPVLGLVVLLAALAITGVLRGWRWQLRLAVYAVWACALGLVISANLPPR